MRNKTVLFLIIFVYCTLLFSHNSYSKPNIPQTFVNLVIADDNGKQKSLDYIRKNWEPSFTIMMLEVIYLTRGPAITAEYLKLMEEKTGKNFGYNIDAWYEWIWNQENIDHEDYADFKSLLYSIIDPKFAAYFNSNYKSKIRLDEVRWGGVVQDGIPPLRNPKMISAPEAKYLEDSNIVFGIEVNGDARAYPKRILAWHEMFVDDVGGIPVAGVYCTLCGSMILYKTEVNGFNHKIGTSGFLYRSNKLIYDKNTQSLWNTLWGRPVIGQLANKDIQLEKMSIVTTTWGEWKKRHPGTKVLSLDTGHRRDYREGAAYNQYFATDKLMFTVPKLDKRLKNKDEVLGLIFVENADKPFAVSSAYLSVNPIYQNKIGDKGFVVFTDKSGASRVYESKGKKFTGWDKLYSVKDSKDTKWTLSESKIESSDGETLYRLPAHRAFWFGWYSAYPNTKLIF
jgi:hypothetical protein